MSESFDLALLGLGLPDKPGLEVSSDLKHAHPDLPVVVLSGEEDCAASRYRRNQGTWLFERVAAGISRDQSYQLVLEVARRGLVLRTTASPPR